ncbi:MAG: hypothetical protein JST39_07695 [Bacteroidetes bacterium]|nr:hypothetical protein [Bacteroidota bacterium]
MMSHTQRLPVLLVAAFAIETFSVTYGFKFEGYEAWFSVLYFIAGISIAVIMVLFPQVNIRLFNTGSIPRPMKWIQVLLFLIAGGIICWQSKQLIDSMPIDINYADMLPVIKVMDQRFIDGHWKHIYDTVPEIWGGIKPIYLPGIWTPFVPAVAMGIDMRWTTVAILLIVFGSYLLSFYAPKQKILSFITLAIASMLLWWLLTEDDEHGLITRTEEGTVILYYVLVVLALLSEHIVTAGVAVSLCMLSRYSLVGWVPAFLLFLVLSKQTRKAFVFSATGLICLIILFILPFGWELIHELSQLPGKYVPFAARVWNDSPEVFSSGAGMARFFGPNRIALQHRLLISLSFIVPLVFMLICHFVNKKRPLANVPLAALKICVVVFYNLVDVPYLYLFYTSSFISLIIVTFFLKHSNDPRPGELSVVSSEL